MLLITLAMQIAITTAIKDSASSPAPSPPGSSRRTVGRARIPDICIYTYMCVHTYIYIYTHVYTYVCIHNTYIHTYTCIMYTYIIHV